MQAWPSWQQDGEHVLQHARQTCLRDLSWPMYRLALDAAESRPAFRLLLPNRLATDSLGVTNSPGS